MGSGIAEAALFVIGAGVLAKYTGAGYGLAELGLGVEALAASPLTGTGKGLTGLAGGIRSIAESFGDIGRGIGEIFAAIPRGPLTGIPFSPISYPIQQVQPIQPINPPYQVQYLTYNTSGGPSSNTTMNSSLFRHAESIPGGVIAF